MSSAPALIGAAILAAGAAKRFGSDKRLHPIDGMPMLARTLAAYRAVFADVAVVIRPRERTVANLVAAAGCRTVEAEHAHQGQSRSLAAVVDAMCQFDGLIVGLADMPFVQRTTLEALRTALVENPEHIVRPVYEGRPGNPIGFPRRLFAKLTRIAGDIGARQVIAADDRIRLVHVIDDGIHRDIDTPQSVEPPSRPLA